MNIKRIAAMACAAMLMCTAQVMAQSTEDASGTPQGSGHRQLPPSPEQQAALETHLMDSLLNLTEEQRSKLYKVNLKQAQQQAELFAGNGRREMGGPPRQGDRPPRQMNTDDSQSGDFDQNGFGAPGDRPNPMDSIGGQRQNAEKLRENTEKEIKKILTDEQYEKWQTVRQEMAKANSMKRKHDKPMPGRDEDNAKEDGD